jgi:hypothetical protein
MNQISGPERNRGATIGPGRSGGAWDAGKAMPVAGSVLRQPNALLFASRPLPAVDLAKLRSDPEARKAIIEKRRAAMTEREPVAEATREKLRASWRDPEIRKARNEKRLATIIERGIMIRWEPNMDLSLCIRLAAGHSRDSIAKHIGVDRGTAVRRGRFLGFIGT